MNNSDSENIEPKTRIYIFKARPILELQYQGRVPFSFGLMKAKVLLENIDAIREFVEICESNPIPIEKIQERAKQNKPDVEQKLIQLAKTILRNAKKLK